MYQNRVVIISRDENISIPIQELLLENGLEVNTVKSIEDMFEEFIKNLHVLTIIDAGSYSEDTLKVVNYLQGAKTAPILVLLSENGFIDRLELFRKGATVCMGADASPEERLRPWHLSTSTAQEMIINIGNRLYLARRLLLTRNTEWSY